MGTHQIFLEVFGREGFFAFGTNEFIKVFGHTSLS
jgi:hypothetical protein